VYQNSNYISVINTHTHTQKHLLLHRIKKTILFLTMEIIVLISTLLHESTRRHLDLGSMTSFEYFQTKLLYRINTIIVLNCEIHVWSMDYGHM